MKKVMLIISLLISSQCGFAQVSVTVLSDKGGLPVDHYFKKIEKKGADDWLSDASKTPETPNPIENFNFNNRFPIVTKEMRVGKVKSRKFKHPLHLAAEFAIVGFDKHSWNWLQNNKAQFEKNGTSILVVNVKTAKQLEAIRKLMSKNNVEAVPGQDIAKQLKINRYPFLISSTGISQ